MPTYELRSQKTGRTYEVDFTNPPSETDIDEAISQFDVGSKPTTDAGYLSQLGSALSVGSRQMASGVKATFNAATGDVADTAEAMAQMGALQNEQQANQSQKDIELNRDFAQNKAEYDRARGIFPTISALGGYVGSIASNPGAAFKQAVQSAPNAAISAGTGLAGYALGGLLGAGAGIETGPGAILTGIAGAAAGGAVSNSLMEAGPAIYDILNERTNGAASSMTADQIAQVLQQNPDIMSEGLKTGAIRGSVIGVIEGLGMKGAGRLMSIPERAAARAAQKTLIGAGVDVASKEAVETALLDPALKSAVSLAAKTAKDEFTSTGNLARLAGAAGLEIGTAGAGEVGAQVATGQEIDPTAAVQEMMGEVGLSIPIATVAKGFELAETMQNPGLSAAVQTADNLVTTAVDVSPDVSKVAEAALNVIQGVVDSTPPAKVDTNLDIPEVEIAPTVGETAPPEVDILADVESGITDAGLAEGNVIQDFGIELQEIQRESGEPRETLFELPPPQKRNLSQLRDAVVRQMDETQALVDGGEISSLTPQYDLLLNKYRRLETLLGKIESKMLPPSPAMEMPKKSSQTITDSNGEIAPEMSVPPPTAEAGAGAGEAIQAPKKKRGRKPALAPQAQEMLAQAAAINAGEQTAAPSTNEFVQKMTGQGPAQPITPTTETPTPATEGKVMPGGSAMERDVTRADEIIDDSKSDRIVDMSGGVGSAIGQREMDQPSGTRYPPAQTLADKKEFPAFERKKIDATFERILKRKSTIPLINGMFQVPYSVALKDPSLRPTNRDEQSVRYRTSTKGEVTGDFNARDSRDTIIFDESVRGARAPTQQSPQTTASETQTPAPSRKGAGASGSVQSEPVEGSIPAVERESAITAIESTGKTDVGYGEKLNSARKVIRALGPDSIKAQQQALNGLMSMSVDELQSSFEVVTGDKTKLSNKRQLANNILNEILLSEKSGESSSVNQIFQQSEREAAIQEIADDSIDLNPITDEMVDSSLSPVEKREAANILRKKTWADSRALFKQRMADWMAGANETSKKLIKFFKAVASKARLLLAASIGLSMANSTSDANLANNSQFRALPIPIANILNSKPARPQFGSLPDMTIGIPEQKMPLGAGDVNLSVKRKIDAKGKNISFDAAKTAQWVLDTGDSDGYPFIVTDKVGATMYFFDKNGVLLRKSPVLVGKNVGDFIGHTDAGRVTPSGRFEIAPETDATYGNVFSVMGTDMIDSESGDLVEVAIHRLSLHDPSENRPKRIATATPLDNRISWGCMNLDNKVMDWAVNKYPLGGVIYILPETADGRSAFAPFNESNIESSKLLTKSSNVDSRDDLESREDKRLKLAQNKREELNLKTLNSLIEKTRTNVVQGAVKPADAQQAISILNKSGEIPNVLFTWIGTSKDFLADPANKARYPDTWKAVSANSNIEGMSENGQPIVFTDNVGVSDLDRKLANLQGTTPEVAAVRRVILHENIHKGMFFLSLKEKMKLFQFLHRLYSPEELDQLAKSYDEYADWRTNQVSYFSIIEEAMTRDFDSMVEIPRDGIWAEFMQFLREIWQKITGKTSEPKLKDYKDVFRLIRNSLKNSEKANADRLKNGGSVRMSMALVNNSLSIADARSKFSDLLRARKVSTVDSSVSGRINDSQVLDPIIEAIPVDVMNVFGSKELATDALLNNPAMFQDALATAKANNLIGESTITRLRDEAMSVAAGARAELASIPLTSLDRKMFAAVDALQHNLITAMGNESAIGSGGGNNPFGAVKYSRRAGDGVAGGMAESPLPASYFAGMFKKLGSTDFTDAFNLHRGMNTPEVVTNQEISYNPATGDKRGKGLSALFPRQATIQDAYRAAAQGQSSQFISLSDVFARAKEANPSLTEEAFKAEVTRLYDSGAIYLEGANSTQEAETASLSIPGTSVGTAVRIAIPESKYESNGPNQPNKASVIPYTSEGYGSQRMEGVSTGDNSPRAQAIRKGVSESNWNELSPTQRAKALEEFGLKSIQSRYSFDASILPVRVTNERTPKNRPASIFSSSPTPAVTIKFDTSGLAHLLNSDAVTAFANVFDMAQEEVIHTAQHLNTYKAWQDKGSIGLFENFEIEHYAEMLFEMYQAASQGLKNGDVRAANVIVSAWNLYNPNLPTNDIQVILQQLAESKSVPAFAMEVGRQLLQFKRQDFTTETGWMRFVEAMKAILADITNALKTALAMAKNGQVGKRLQDEIIEVDALMNELESAGQQPMASKVEYDSTNDAAFNSGAEVARNTDYDERDKAVRSTIRAAYDLAPKDNGPSVPLGQLFDIAKQSMPDLTKAEFSQILQDLYEDSGALLQAGESPFIVTTQDGQRAGSAIIVSSLPTGAMASTIDPDSTASKEFTKDIQDIESGTLKAAFAGRQFKDFKPIERTIKPAKSFQTAAIGYVDSLEAEGKSLEEIANSVISPSFLESIGIEQDLMAQDALTIEVRQRVDDAKRKERSPAKKKQLSKLSERLSAFWQGVGSKKGQHLGQRRYLVNKARYSWMFIRDIAEKAMKEARTNILVSNFGDENATSFTQNSYDNADVAKNASVDNSVENVDKTQDDIDLEAGATALQGKEKTLWEKFKDIIRQRGLLIRRLGELDAKSAAKKSISDSERNAISQMTREEVLAALEKNSKDMQDVYNEFVNSGRESTKDDRENMAKIAKKRADKGLTLESLDSDSALAQMLREINQARRGAEVPLKNPIPWRKLLSKDASTVEEYRQRIFDAISSSEELKSATPEQKARLADLFAEAWESNRTRILDNMLERMIREQEAQKNLSKEGAKALQAQRMRIVEDINLGVFDNDELAKIMAEKFGIKSEFTETEKEKIDELIDVLQDEKLNAVKRQVAAYKLLEVLQGELNVPVSRMLADFWVSSVLSGPNTIVSIGLAVASGMFELSTALSRVFIAAGTNQKQLPSELAGAYKTLARLLSAYGRQANIAWQYLVSGDPAFLDPSMNDVTENMQWGNIGKSNKLAEQMAKSDKILVKSMGLFMRTVSRLLTALDVFNSGLTKEGSLSIVFRQIGLDPEKIAMMEKKSDLKPYKDAIIARDFGETPPKTARDKALLDSYALSDMMAELDRLGNVSENANQIAMQGAMTLDPSGLGGVGYRAIRSLVTGFERGSDKFLKQAQRGWQDNDDRALAGIKLAFAYLMQFGAYNAANFGGVRFARFAGNKFNQGLSFIPALGFARTFEAEFDADRVQGKEAFIDMIRRNQIIGVMIAAAGYQVLKAIADEPDDEKRGWFINGGWGNLTPEKKQQKLAAGEKEYTIGIGDRVFNYSNWPISSILAAVGSLSDMIRFSPEQWKDKNVANVMASAAMSGAAAAADIPALSQFQELFGNSLSSKDPNEKRMERFAKVMSGYAGGFIPRFLKDIDYLADPNLRKYETLWEKTASHIPVYRRYEGKEYYDILGQQIQRNIYPGSREFMSKPTDPVYKILGALNSRGIWLTPANAEHRMVGKGARRRKLTQEEADNYGLETGKGYKQMLLRYGQRALQMPTERARDFLLDKADDVRDKALKKVYRGYTPAS